MADIPDSANSELAGLADLARSADQGAAPGAAAAPGVDPGDDAAPGAGEGDKLREAVGISRFVLEFVANNVQDQFPVLAYDERTRQAGAEKLAPVLVKYKVMDRIFLKWRAEFECGAFFAGVIWESVRQVKKSRQQQSPTPPVEKPAGA